MRLNWELTALESRCRTFPSALGLQKTTSFQEKWELKILTAAAEWFDGISTEDLMELDEHELLVLRATADALRLNDKAYVTVKEIWEYYEMACAAKEVKPLSYEKVKEYVHDLHCRGLVHQSKKGVSVVGAPVRDLSRVIPTIERGERLEWRG